MTDSSSPDTPASPTPPLSDELLEASAGSDAVGLQEEVWDLLVAWAQTGLLAGFEGTSEWNPTAVPARVRGFRPSSETLILWTDDWKEKSEGTECSLPDGSVRRILLPRAVSSSPPRPRRLTPAAALDTLVRWVDGEIRFSLSEAREWVEWIQLCEVFEIAIVPGAAANPSKAVEEAFSVFGSG